MLYKHQFMQDTKPMHNANLGIAPQVEKLAESAFSLISRTFPVCSGSDEFYFFPQAVTENSHWHDWDNFSGEAIAAFLRNLSPIENQLSALQSRVETREDKINLSLLLNSFMSLRTQLVEVAPHRSQPTFHLTVIVAGLTEALEADDAGLWSERVAGVPKFLQQAKDCLHDVPEVFHKLGLDMLADLHHWTIQLAARGFEVARLSSALSEFKTALNNLAITSAFQLPKDLLNRLLSDHLGLGIGFEDIRLALENERLQMTELLDHQANRLAPSKSWQELCRLIPRQPLPENGFLELYHGELRKLEWHCRDRGMIPKHTPKNAKLEIAVVPPHLATIRASDAYSATPGYPSKGGKYYIMEPKQPQDGAAGPTVEYRLTTIHETWPGHHLLDLCRWSLHSPVRRPLERPLFYEGWACLAEQIMARSGYLDHPWDHFLLAKRRLERAVRGLVDLGLQTGSFCFDQGRALLVAAGYSPRRADTVIPKYLLRPGYQICYTLGLKHGLALLDQHGGQDLGGFVQRFLGEGEIDFDWMHQIIGLTE
jgi:hypothetical protein